MNIKKNKKKKKCISEGETVRARPTEGKRQTVKETVWGGGEDERPTGRWLGGRRRVENVQN